MDILRKDRIGERKFDRGALGAVIKALGATTKLGGEEPRIEDEPVLGEVTEQGVVESFVKDPEATLDATRAKRGISKPWG